MTAGIAEQLAVAHVRDAARTLTGRSVAGPLGNALIWLHAAMTSVSRQLDEETAAQQSLADRDPYELAGLMVASGMPETVDGRSIWGMGTAELARLAVTDYPGGACELLSLSDPDGSV